MHRSFLLEVSNLSFSVQDRVILQDVTFTLSPGQIVGLVGINGAGKTTTLNILGGLTTPSSGRVLLGDTELNDSPLIRQQNVGFLPDPLPFYPELTVNEYLLFNAKIRCINGPRIAHRIERVTEYFELKLFIKQTMGSLSRGQRQRVGLAQAMLHQPKLLLLDEPTNGLDPIQRAHFLGFIRKLAQSVTVLMSSHDLGEIKHVCNRLLLLNQGRLTEHAVEDAAKMFADFSDIAFEKPAENIMVDNHAVDTG